MSTWIEIKKQEDIDYDSKSKDHIRDDSIDVFISNDKFGNNYVTIPVRFIINVLEENGFKIKY